MAHIPGLENVMADALTRQYDEVEATAVVHSVVHSLTDVDLAEVAREQPRIEDEPPSSLRLEGIKFPGTEQMVVCDTSLGRPRVLIPEPKRRAIFEAEHNLAHPSGKATLAIIAWSYAWPNMRRDILRWATQCQSCRMCKTARHAKPPVKPIPVLAERFQQVHVDIVGPFTSERGFRYILTMIDRTTRWPRSISAGGYNSGNGPAGIHDGVDRSVWGTRNSDVGPWNTVHVRGVEVGIGEVRNSSFHHNVLPPAGEWDGGKVSPRPQGGPPLHCPVEQVLGQVTAVGSARFAKCAEGRDINVNSRSVVRYTTAGPRHVLPGCTAVEAVSQGTARAGEV